MKTLKLITILSFIQFFAFTSFGAINPNESVRPAQDKALRVLNPTEFAAIAGTSSLEAELIIQAVVTNTLNISSRAVVERRIEALLNAAYAANRKSKVNLYEHLAFLKTTQYKANLQRVLSRIQNQGNEGRLKAQRIQAELNSVI